VRVTSPARSTPATSPSLARYIPWTLQRGGVFVPISSTVSDGWFTLDGTVEMWSQSYDAERAVENLIGVKGVMNRITVKPPRPVTGDVRKAIEQALERRAEREAKHINVDVRDSVVTLTGTFATRFAPVSA